MKKGTARALLLSAWMVWWMNPGGQAQDWHLVWADEFEGESLDPEKWSYQTGTGSEYGLTDWGNNEGQYYREQNVSVADGFLTITARKEDFGGKDYTSGRIRSAEKGDWTYGRIEFRAKMPVGQGMWAAVWMLPTDAVYGGWAASGEIDILEYLGHETDKVYGTLHYGGPWPNNQSTSNSFTLDEGDFSGEFHDFALEWTEGKMRWFVDGERYQTLTAWSSSGGSYPAPFNRRFHLLVNLAVGGDWPGYPNSSTSFPQELVLDYIRVYQEGATGNPRQEVSGGFGIDPVVPNPVLSGARITYRIGEECRVSLAIFDGTGRLMARLADGVKAKGLHEAVWDRGSLAPGVYSCRLSAGERTAVRKILVR
ncbi:MAG: family 16 glycosylhydrolase [Bacteroidales bacterium]